MRFTCVADEIQNTGQTGRGQTAVACYLIGGSGRGRTYAEEILTFSDIHCRIAISLAPTNMCVCVCVCAREHARACTIYGLRIIRRDVPRCSSSILCDDINVVSVGVHMRMCVRVSVRYGSVTVVDVVGVVVARRRRRATVVCLFAFALLMSILE